MGTRRARQAIAISAALPWAICAALRVTGGERGFPLVPAMAFSRYAALTSPLPAVLAARAGSRTGLLLAVGAGGVLGAPLVGRHRSIPPPPTALPTEPPPVGEHLRIATVSLRKGLVHAAPVLELVRNHDIDILSVQELTPECEQQLRAAGLDTLLPWSHVLPARPGSVSSASGALWTRMAIVGRHAVPGCYEQPTVRLRREAGPDIEVTAVHTSPPATSPGAVRRWTADLAALPAPDPDVLRILAGDFNATLDHAALRAVLRRGWIEAATAAGQAAAWTWRPLRCPFPRLGLDHVLVDPRIGVAGVRFVDVSGSDHRAVVTDLVLPRR